MSLFQSRCRCTFVDKESWFYARTIISLYLLWESFLHKLPAKQRNLRNSYQVEKKTKLCIVKKQNLAICVWKKNCLGQKLCIFFCFKSLVKSARTKIKIWNSFADFHFGRKSIKTDRIYEREIVSKLLC